MCRSGSAADTQNMSAYVQLFLAQHGMEMGREPDVKTAAKLAATLCYQNKVCCSPPSHDFSGALARALSPPLPSPYIPFFGNVGFPLHSVSLSSSLCFYGSRLSATFVEFCRTSLLNTFFPTFFKSEPCLTEGGRAPSGSSLCAESFSKKGLFYTMGPLLRPCRGRLAGVPLFVEFWDMSMSDIPIELADSSLSHFRCHLG